jgi:hypothetical protein
MRISTLRRFPHSALLQCPYPSMVDLENFSGKVWAWHIGSRMWMRLLLCWSPWTRSISYVFATWIVLVAQRPLHKPECIESTASTNRKYPQKTQNQHGTSHAIRKRKVHEHRGRWHSSLWIRILRKRYCGRWKLEKRALAQVASQHSHLCEGHRTKIGTRTLYYQDQN